MHRVERARPLLGTLVSLRAWSEDEARAQAACDAAFAEVERVHRAMSFHDETSDISRLNAQAHLRSVEVDARTYAVLSRAQFLHAASGGCFDITVAPLLVDNGALPRARTSIPHANSSAADVRLLGQRRIRFARPLWIDVGGIAKGYAVDRAVATLRAHGIHGGSVNAGGDLSVFGPTAERVMIRPAEPSPGEARPVIEVRNHALATSSTDGRLHWHGRARRGVPAGLTAVVAARRAWLADALTKVVLCDDWQAARCLSRFGARAYLQRAAGALSELAAA